MTFYQAYPWVLPTFLALGSLGFAVFVWSQVESKKARRLATVSAFVVALAIGAAQVGPQVWTDICYWDPFLIECWLPY